MIHLILPHLLEKLCLEFFLYLRSLSEIIIQQRTKAGLEAARKRGRVGGRPAIDDKVKKHVRAFFEAGESATDISKEYGIGRATVYKIKNEQK